jgi:hypothetical protein
MTNFRALSTNFSTINTFVEEINKSIMENCVDNRYSSLQKKIRDDFILINKIHTEKKYHEDGTLEVLTFLSKWIKILIIIITNTEHRKIASSSKFAANILDVFNISQHPCLFSTNTTTARFLEVKGLDSQHLDIPGRHDSSVNFSVRIKLMMIQASTKLHNINNILYRRLYFIGNDGRSYAFNAGQSDLSSQSIYNIVQVLNWTLMQYSLGKKSNLSLKSMISPIPITHKILITRVISDDYASLNDLLKDYNNASTGLDYFSHIIEGRTSIVRTMSLDSNNLNAAKIAAYKSGKSMIPTDLLQNYFYNQWNLSIDYYSRRRIFCHDLGLNGAFQLLINANSLNADEFIITHDGHLDCGFFSTSYVTDDFEDNKIALNDFDHVAMRLTRNIQKVVSLSSDIVVSIIGCSFDAFITNVDVTEIGLQIYFLESLLCIQLNIPEGLEKQEYLIQCAKQLTRATLRRLRLYAPQLAAKVDKKPTDYSNTKPIDHNIREVVNESMDEENIALMDIAEWIPLL